MISFDQARVIAESIVGDSGRKLSADVVIVADGIIEKPYAWIFPYTTKRRLEGDLNYAIAGNSPLFVDKRDGRVSTFPTWLTMDGMIDAYEERNSTWRLNVPVDVYWDTRLLSALKKYLHLTQDQVSRWKSKQEATIDMGAQVRLEKLAALLLTDGIECVVVLNEDQSSENAQNEA